MKMLYDDGRISCDEEGLVIGWYYLWGRKRIPYRSIASFDTFAMSRLRGKWRIWGSGDFVHWWNLDPHRVSKRMALVIDIGQRVRPTITPDDPDAVERILNQRLSK